jgi:hypothetical protein
MRILANGLNYLGYNKYYFASLANVVRLNWYLIDVSYLCYGISCEKYIVLYLVAI